MARWSGTSPSATPGRESPRAVASLAKRCMTISETQEAWSAMLGDCRLKASTDLLSSWSCCSRSLRMASASAREYMSPSLDSSSPKRPSSSREVSAQASFRCEPSFSSARVAMDVTSSNFRSRRSIRPHCSLRRSRQPLASPRHSEAFDSTCLMRASTRASVACRSCLSSRQSCSVASTREMFSCTNRCCSAFSRSKLAASSCTTA
mmetsp:Transcript_58692/g.117448  ORF Transcript_58692/g.117448 Transcript_58692/m.117448 type:complete len:206 (-) Transcript_58692:100-717(-)